LKWVESHHLGHQLFAQPPPVILEISRSLLQAKRNTLPYTEQGISI